MNPYDFVRIEWESGVERRPYQPHNRFDGLCGRLQGTIKTLTPFFIPESAERSPRLYLVNRHNEAIIPGSSLKGLIRSLVETIGPGCWWLFDGRYNDGRGGQVYYNGKLPRAFHQCPDNKGNLCVACRMFGMIEQSGDTLLLGNVGFDDAVCAEPVAEDAFYTIILSTPKARHDAFYLDASQNYLAGRKYYYHHSRPPVDVKGWLPKGAPGHKKQNNYIKPVGAGSVFTFSAYFNNLSEDELRLLLYALVLEPEMRHKIGYGKPAGLGSVEIRLTHLEMIDYAQRYRTNGDGQCVYEGEALEAFVSDQIAPYVSDKSAITLQDLRRIWAWPGRDDIQYPDWEWFQDNTSVRLPGTP